MARCPKCSGRIGMLCVRCPHCDHAFPDTEPAQEQPTPIGTLVTVVFSLGSIVTGAIALWRFLRS